ncbi:MAG: hypothetical protein WCW84_13065, partial [Sulfurimonas sp.]
AGDVILKYVKSEKIAEFYMRGFNENEPYFFKFFFSYVRNCLISEDVDLSNSSEIIKLLLNYTPIGFNTRWARRQLSSSDLGRLMVSVLSDSEKIIDEIRWDEI